MINRLSWHQKVILYLFHFLVLATPLYFSFNTEELFEFNKMLLTYAVTTLIVVVWMFRMAAEKRLIFRRTFLDIPLLLFLISQIISTVLSMHPRTSLLGYYSRFHGGLASTVSYYALYYAFVSNIPLKAIYQFFYTAFISAGLVAIYGILEHFGHSTSCYLLTGGQSFGVDCWVQKVQERVFATFGQPNWLAAYAITLIPVGMVIALREKTSMLWRILVGSSTVLLFMALLFTMSRSGLIGFALSMAVMAVGLLILGKKTSAGIAQKLTKGFAAIVAAFVLIAAAFGTAYTPPVSELLSQNQEQAASADAAADPSVNRLEVGGTASGEIRKIVWTGAIDVWKRYPAFGSGVETFAYSYYKDRPVEHNLVSEWDFLYNKAHNEFLNFLATTGAVGLATYVALLSWFFIAALKFILRTKKSASTITEQQAMVLALSSGLAGLTVSNFFGFSTVMVSVLMYLYFAILASYLIAEKEKTTAINLVSHKNKLQSGWQFGLSSLAVLFGLILLAQIYNYRQADAAFSQGKTLISSGQTQAGLSSLQEAAGRSPQEALFFDELSDVYAKMAVKSLEVGEATQAAELASAAIGLSDETIRLNPAHLNFYKTRARIYLALAQLQPSFLEDAKATLEQAIERSPTDAKLWYNLGLVEWGLENHQASQQAFEKSVELKPDYESARLQLGSVYQANGDIEAAREQYQYVLDHISADNPTAKAALDALP